MKDIILNQNYDPYLKDFGESDWDLRKSQATRTILGQSPRFVMEGLGMTLIAIFCLYLFIKWQFLYNPTSMWGLLH